MHRLANTLCNRGHRVTCFSFSPLPADALYGHRLLSYNLRIKPARKFAPAVAFSRQDCRGFDVVHYHGDDYLSRGDRRRVRTFYGSAIDEARHARTPGRFVYQALFYLFEIISAVRRGVKVGISQATCDAIPFVTSHIPCGVPLDKYNAGDTKSEYPSILFIGDMNSRKRGSLLVRIFNSYIRPRHPDSRLAIVGPETVRGEGIEYLGQVSEDRLIKQYRTSWVYCMASSYEGFGVPAIEAMACGTAVVAVDNPGTRDIIDDARTGLLTSDTGLAAGLHSVLSDTMLRRRLEKAGMAKAVREYSMDVVAARYEDIYERTRRP